MNSPSIYSLASTPFHPDLPLLFLSPEQCIEMNGHDFFSFFRFVFGAEHTYLEEEKACLVSFLSLLDEYRIDPQPFSSPAYLLRFLYSNEFDLERAAGDLKNLLSWHKKNFPIAYEGNIKELIESNMIYSAGLDCFQRPIVIFNYNTYYEVTKKYNKDEIIKAFSFFLDFLIETRTKDGQVENLIMIVDATNFGITSINNDFKELAKVFDQVFRRRLHRVFVVNLSGLAGMAFTMGVKLLNERFREKVVKIDASNKQMMLDLINPSQLEKKYLGKANNLSGCLFPPVGLGDEIYTRKNSRSRVLKISVNLEEHNFGLIGTLFGRSQKLRKFYKDYVVDKKEEMKIAEEHVRHN